MGATRQVSSTTSPSSSRGAMARLTSALTLDTSAQRARVTPLVSRKRPLDFAIFMVAQAKAAEGHWGENWRFELQPLRSRRGVAKRPGNGCRGATGAKALIADSTPNSKPKLLRRVPRTLQRRGRSTLYISRYGRIITLNCATSARILLTIGGRRFGAPVAKGRARP